MRILILALISLSFPLKAEDPWGKNADLSYSPPEEQVKERSIAAKMAMQVIAFRQNVLTLADGPRSHFSPTSSQYMKDAIIKYGFVKGYLMGCDRLMRENSEPWIYPLSKSGNSYKKYDPVQ